MASSAARQDKTRPPTHSRAASRKGQLKDQVGTSRFGGELALCWCDSCQINVEVSPEFMIDQLESTAPCVIIMLARIIIMIAAQLTSQLKLIIINLKALTFDIKEALGHNLYFAPLQLFTVN